MTEFKNTSKAFKIRGFLHSIAWALRDGKLDDENAARLINLVATRVGNRKPVHKGKPQQRIKDRENQSAIIRAALEADPMAPYWKIGAEVGCDTARVAEVARRLEYERNTPPEERTTGHQAPAQSFPDELLSLLADFMRREKRGDNDGGS